MADINVRKSKEYLMIEWQTAEINIPLEDIVDVDGGNNDILEKSDIVKIGKRNERSDYILIRTKKFDYALFTMDKDLLLNKINL
ncbi:SunI/YnzG family protein [Bacillus gaemokensis]|uniref:Sublancin immunity protein SunI-like PH domain-containing protein n=1 Tax=Bacillus gaemokensis TaxID=574375 RepID=A0A073K8S9_9BACI|nr:hypothetical protein [Bacillus gaemokensis]KEK22940.1 hypothetical protein BAGA_14775 [Bacillus gaemokensis]KYG37502.1 hypothetical protein AZF08_23850 [Bacillus gaemokensis]